MGQKFFYFPQRESVADITYRILRRNEMTGDLKLMKGEFRDEETCKKLASFVNDLSSDNSL